MSTILHLSDFHLGKNPELEQERLMSLAEWLVHQNIKIDFLIFTGDMIDAREISKKCIRNFFTENKSYGDKDISKVDENIDNYLHCICDNGSKHIKLYNEMLNDQYIVEFGKAKLLFDRFINKLKISNQNIILCCGNHDRVRPLVDNKTSFACKNDIINESDYRIYFDAYNSFCSSINPNLSYSTSVYKHQGINFVIANSNWKSPQGNESNKMCVNCGLLSEEINKLRASSYYNRNKTIFVSHKPFDDICENAKFHYCEDQILTLKQTIEQTAVMFLCGDKHSFNVEINNNLNSYMCGYPLCEDHICYNLIDIDFDNGKCYSKYIKNNGSKWGMRPINDCISEAYSISTPYLKEHAINFINSDSKSFIHWDKAISSISGFINSNKLQYISKFFSSCVTIKDNDGKKIQFDNLKLVDKFFSLIDKSGDRRAISVKGAAGIGKRSFLTIEYLYLLHKFYTGEFKYIPFYFDIDKVINSLKLEQSNSVEEIINQTCQYFNDYINMCINISQKYNYPICLIITGLRKENLLCYSLDTIENRLYGMLESNFKHSQNKYVMSFSTLSEDFKTTFDQINRFAYVIYFNAVRIIPYKAIEKSELFLESYLNLLGQYSLEYYNELKTKIKKLRKLSIDLNFLHRNNKFLSNINIDIDAWKLMKKHVVLLSDVAEDIFGCNKITMLHKAAYMLMYQGKTYVEIITEPTMQTLSIEDFIKMCNNPDISEYLLARYFVDELIKYSRITECIPDDSILHCFLTRDISIIIRLILENRTDYQSSIIDFIKNHNNELSGFLFSTLVYIAGHLKNEFGIKLLDNISKLDNKTEGQFFKWCHSRSLKLANIVSTNSTTLTDKFVHELMDDESLRLFNRVYQLRYYQDIPSSKGSRVAEWRLEGSVKSGFDFHNCFFILVSKLEFAFNLSKSYPIMVIDLFTICDLIYSRFQDIHKEKALFYSEKYNQKNDSLAINILKKASDLIAKYLNNKLIMQSHSKRINTYFVFMKKKYAEIISILKDPSNKNIYPLISQYSTYDRILKLNEKPRVGWNIDHIGQIKKEDQPTYTKSNEETKDPIKGDVPIIYETTMQRIIETVYIAQMFLPESSDLIDYNKSLIISLILMCDLGKTETGDYSPEYSNFKTLNKNEQCQLTEMLVIGSLDGYANNGIYYDYFDANNGSLKNDINIIICNELKAIQMEYKYYSLYEQLKFDDNRRKDFENEFKEPTVKICQDIRQMLIIDNDQFKKYFSE